MSKQGMNPKTKTGRINLAIFEILENNPAGIRWVELDKLVKEAEPSLHPKTINGCIWKLTETFPDKIHKPAKGLFQLKKYSKDGPTQ